VNSLIIGTGTGSLAFGDIYANSISTGAVNASTLSTLNLNVCTINGLTFGGPIQSTVIGLGSAGYISSTQLFSSLAGLVVGSTFALSTGSVTASLLSTLNINVCTINGQTFGGPIQSTVIGLGSAGYISSSQLFSSLSALAITSTSILSAATINVSTIRAVNLSTALVSLSTLNLVDQSSPTTVGNLYQSSAVLYYNGYVVAGTTALNIQTITF
jgi:hypothetical protein